MTGPAERPSRKPPETRTAAAAAQTEPRADLRASHAAERKLLLAIQAAGYALLRRSNNGIAARARAETTVAFAHRWAEIRRLPPALRAAAAAALEAEQAAALSARTTYLLGELHHQHRAAHAQLRHLFGAQRKALSRRHREAGAAAAATAARRQSCRPPTRPAIQRQAIERAFTSKTTPWARTLE